MQSTLELELPKAKKKRASKRYWKEINGTVYVRLQYKDESGKWKEKLQRIDDKRTAQTVVEKMRRELEHHGAEILKSDKMMFKDLADKYEKTKLVSAVYSNGVKVSGKRSIAPVKSALKPLVEYFGRKFIRSIRPNDLEAYKSKRLATPVETETNVKTKQKNPETGRMKNTVTKEIKTRPRQVATVNRELALMRNILNFAIQNDWLIKSPFTKSPGIVSNSAEVQRDRVLSFNEESKLLAACVDQRAHIKPLLICALDTGMRRGEMFKMRWSDVNFVTDEIYIPQTNTKTDADSDSRYNTTIKNRI
ncbi:MAG TPA: tyrosine-type recombinase/integrase [Pyrinomonadaceae bacterium]|jgi:hypothetical protein